MLISAHLACKDLHFALDHRHEPRLLLSTGSCLLFWLRGWCILPFLVSAGGALKFSDARPRGWRMQLCRMIFPAITPFDFAGRWSLLCLCCAYLDVLWRTLSLLAVLRSEIRFFDVFAIKVRLVNVTLERS